MPQETDGLSTNKQILRDVGSTLCVFVAGGGAGWLIGLSTSPGVQSVISAVIAFLISVVGLLAGIETKKKDEAGGQTMRVRPLPVAALIAGLAIGSAGGVRARTSDWLGVDLEPQIKRWEEAGLPRREVAQRLFERHFSNAEGKTPAELGVLFKVSVDERAAMLGAPDDKLRQVMRSVKDQHVRQFADACDDIKCLKAAVKELICPEK